MEGSRNLEAVAEWHVSLVVLRRVSISINEQFGTLVCMVVGEDLNKFG